jgi:Kef-type K+ transport system membrane component KefB/nucleotide-binding universal stress UspA family protein
MTHLSESEVLRFLAQFTILFVSARLLADFMKRVGQATVIGELLAGIILGTSVLGHLSPTLYHFIFPPDPNADHLLEALAWIGVIMLLLYTGLETDLDILRSVGRTSVLVSALGILIPCASGFALGWEMPASYLANSNARLIFALFLAVAMSISAVPLIAKILIDMDLMRRDIGMLILAAGILDDTVGWLMLSMVAGLATHGAIDLKSIGSILLAVLVFIGSCYFVVAKLVVRIMRWVDDRALAEHAGVSAMVGIAMVCGIVTQAIGIHAVFGAFIAGVMIGRSARLRKSDRTDLEAATIGVFAPVFFAYSGLKVDLFALHGVSLLAIVLSIAVLGKLIGCTSGSLISGLGMREALAVGVGMNARGGMEIVVALIGLSLGVLTQEMYAVIIIVAIATSMMTPPLLGCLLAGIEQPPEEANRLERDKMLANLPFSKEGAKLLVLAGGGLHAQLAAHLAAVLGNHPDASITIFHATAGEDLSAEAKERLDEHFETLTAIAELAGAHNVYQRSGNSDTVSEAILKESGRGYDAIFAGASTAEGDYALGGSILHDLVLHARIPVIIVRNVGAPVPFRRLLAPTTGTSFSRLATTIGVLYAHATKASLTPIYIKESPLISFRNLPGFRRLGDEDLHIVNDIERVAAHFDLKVDPQVAAGNRPENAVLGMAERGHFDLLLIGVTPRPSEQRLYFGPRVEHMLRNAQCAITLVISPLSVTRT